MDIAVQSGQVRHSVAELLWMVQIMEFTFSNFLEVLKNRKGCPPILRRERNGALMNKRFSLAFTGTENRLGKWLASTAQDECEGNSTNGSAAGLPHR